MADAGAERLCGELLTLDEALGAAIGPDTPDAPDRSNQARPALLWCATHHTSHGRDQWRAPVTGPQPREGWCVPGQDPRRASVLVGAARTATTPRHSVRRRVPASSAPLDMAVLGAREDIRAAAVELASDLRYRLGFGERAEDGPRALGEIPGLLGALPPARRQARWVQLGIERLARARRGARLALGLDGRRQWLGECPEVRQPYPVAWSAGGDTPTAWRSDGQCWTYDFEASERAGREAGTPVDRWYRSRLYVRDRCADPDSDEGLVRCTAGTACRTWDARQRLRLAAHLTGPG